MNFYFTLNSKNAKTGAIPVATIDRKTCPDSCPLKNQGCYAESGPLRLHWNKVSDGERGGDFDSFLKQISVLPETQVWRYGQAGDLPGVGDEIDCDMLDRLADANKGRPVIAYTHKPPTKKNLDVLKRAADKGFSVNLSADDYLEADELATTGLPVVMVLPEEYGRTTQKGEWSESIDQYNERTNNLPKTTPNGRRIAVCPATYTDTNCAQCLACAKHDRNGTVIGFPAHGVKRRQVSGRVQMSSDHSIAC